MKRERKGVMMIDLEHVAGPEQMVILGYSSLRQNEKRGISALTDIVTVAHHSWSLELKHGWVHTLLLY